MHLKHLILSHHGQYEYGSPKRPKTIEATVLNYLDDLDSKINGIRTHIKKEGEMQGNWTAYHRLYDRYFYVDRSEEFREEKLPLQPRSSHRLSSPAARPDRCSRNERLSQQPV